MESEQHLAHAKRLTHLGSWIWDIDNGRFSCSEEMRRILGVATEDAVDAYASFLGYVHPVDRPFFEESLRCSQDTGEPFGLEYRIVKVDDTVRWLHGLGLVVDDEGRRVLHGTAQDITECKAAEIARRSLEFELLELTYRERSQLGHHLQNDLGQLLTGVDFLTKRVEQNLAADRHPETAALGEIRELVKLAIEKTRSVARVLASTEIDGQSLQMSLRQLAAQTRRLFTISCDVQESVDPVPEADALTTAHLYRIVQEAISNAVRHGKANAIRIQVRREAVDQMVLAVEDDGVGFENTSNPSTGLGLPIMQHHAQLLGGTLDIESTSAGTRVLCRVATGNTTSRSRESDQHPPVRTR
jgi:PAS domain S-box-containing protein